MKKAILIITIAALLLASVFTLYGCAAAASDNVSYASNTSASAENTAESTEATTENAESPVSESAVESGEPMSYDDFLGIWHLKDNDNNADEIIISGITSEKVDFQFGLFREFGFHTTAIAYDNVYYFGEQYGSDGSLPEGISGRIVFEDGAITITFDSFGVHEKIHYSNIMEYTFTEKTTEYFDVCLD